MRDISSFIEQTHSNIGTEYRYKQAHWWCQINPIIPRKAVNIEIKPSE
jgi:hypothetical protein